MTHLRFALIRLALMKINSRNLLFVTLIAITALSAGCNKSQQDEAPSGPQTFASPEAAIYAAAQSGDSNVVLAIFGPEAKELILSGDPVQDKAALDLFTSRYDEMHRWGKLVNGGMVLAVGAETYPFPFALLTNSS